MTEHRAEGEQYTYGQYLEKTDRRSYPDVQDGRPNTNQAYMTVGEPKAIFLTDPPCLRGIDTRIKDNKLDFYIYFRSWDLWAGFPSNLAAIQLLKNTWHLKSVSTTGKWWS